MNDAILYQVRETAQGFSLTLGAHGLVDGFESKQEALDWLLAYFDNNLVSNTRLGFEREERAAHLVSQIQLQRAALLEVDPNGKSN